MKTVITFVLAALPLLFSGQASADLPPPKDYVEKCALEKQQGRGETCKVCGASFQGRDACLKLGEQGYSHRCATYGASVWEEIWCRASPSRRGKSSSRDHD